MRFFLLLAAVALFAAQAPSWPQAVSSAGSDVPDRSYRLLREDEDWSFLADPKLRQDFWDPIKYIRLRRGRRRLVSHN
jgi:hypothetical protein